MKLIPLIITSFIVTGCSPNKDADLVQQDFALVTANFSIENPKIILAVKEYIANNNGDPSRVYTMLLSRENLVTKSFQMSAISTHSELNELIPYGYFTIDDDIILVYTGLENLSEKDERFIKKLKETIGDKLEYDLMEDGKTRDPNHRGMIFDPSTWEVTVLQDSIIIDRGVFNRLGPPVVEGIKFLPTKD